MELAAKPVAILKFLMSLHQEFKVKKLLVIPRMVKIKRV